MLQFHHIGCVVRDIDESVRLHREAHGGEVSEKILVSSQQVFVCFAELAPGSFIEFIQPAAPGSAVDGLLKKNVTYYHLGFLAGDFDAALAGMENSGYKSLGVFHSEAFAGRRCVFLFGPDGRLTELIEK